MLVYSSDFEIIEDSVYVGRSEVTLNFLLSIQLFVCYYVAYNIPCLKPITKKTMTTLASRI